MAVPKIIQIPEGDEGALQYHYKRTEVSSAEILTLNSVPLELVEAPGTGSILMPITAIVKYYYGTIVYATNLNLIILLDNGTIVLNFNNLISLGADTVMFSGTGTLAPAQLENEGIELSVQTGDPTAGDGTLVVHLWYINIVL
ncbi:unnamed protein product [marine sediment metagenome]|uniref:Uncharacterized protein n=1 Tax=marine sediment metagenome TaxID=412755 RepID=X1A3I4_9ZZZZ